MQHLNTYAEVEKESSQKREQYKQRHGKEIMISVMLICWYDNA